jgi:hypothetical protein
MRKSLFIFFAVLMSSQAFGQSPVSEDSVKAAYIFHFINFTQWQDTLDNYYVCVPEDEDLRQQLQVSLKGKMINNRKVIVTNQSATCHVLVSEQRPTFSSDTLTIGPLSQGALLEFRLIHNKLKFAANLQRIKRSNLRISSQLLKLAMLENS